MKVQYVDDVSKAKAASLKTLRDAEAPIREAIRRGDYPLTVNPEKQARHMVETAIPGRSVITISMEELQKIVDEQAGSGHIELTRELTWKNKEIVDAGKEIGYTINANGDIITAKSIKIHYSKTGVHAVPNSRWWKK
ncbi:polymorphic toxin type 50 domain-containing protein [Pseudoflavonifractor sp. 524-17]|uniref:polymorphic toxin type 50 domain-containing protein n=1 Tax=Pseudoflavonifractor sp. 524-17 TaxID=2304577 RepID=UPI00243408F6|nr:polymorphic toxin type 50 domain-containing protein [Pseudoflavonifractor sp. 524-17]